MKNAILFLLTTIWVHSARAQSQEIFIPFDQAFIPVWYHSYRQQLPEAVNAIPTLRMQWDRLQQNYAATNPDDQLWHETVATVNHRLEEVEDALSEHNVNLAYNQLDVIKYELMEVRRRNGVSHFIDDWYNLHEAVFEVTCVARDELLDLLEWNEFVSLTRRVEAHWIALEPGATQAVELEWPQTLQQRYDLFGEALYRYREAVDSADQLKVQLQETTFNDAAFELLAAFGLFNQNIILFIR